MKHIRKITVQRSVLCNTILELFCSSTLKFVHYSELRGDTGLFESAVHVECLTKGT